VSVRARGAVNIQHPSGRSVGKFPGPLRPQGEGSGEICLKKEKYIFFRTCPSANKTCVFGPLPPTEGLTPRRAESSQGELTADGLADPPRPCHRLALASSTRCLSAGRGATGAGAQAPGRDLKAGVMEGVATTERKRRAIPAGPGFRPPEVEEARAVGEAGAGRARG